MNMNETTQTAFVSEAKAESYGNLPDDLQFLEQKDVQVGDKWSISSNIDMLQTKSKNWNLAYLRPIEELI